MSLVSNDANDYMLNQQSFEVILDRGTRYMVVDCGGGTVDITVHELDNQLGTLKELYKATGGPYGSVGKDRSNIHRFVIVFFLFYCLLL